MTGMTWSEGGLCRVGMAQTVEKRRCVWWRDDRDMGSRVGSLARFAALLVRSRRSLGGSLYRKGLSKF